MSTRIGTEYFVNKNAAMRYYSSQWQSSGVEAKIKEGAIKFGMPPRKDGYRIVLNNKEGRYFYEEVAPKAEPTPAPVSAAVQAAFTEAENTMARAEETVAIPLIKEGDPVPEFVKAAEGFCGFCMKPTDQCECKGVGENLDANGVEVTPMEAVAGMQHMPPVAAPEQGLKNETEPVEIKTNNVPKELLFFRDLTDKERAALGEREDTNSFFRLKGKVYDAGEFTQINSTHQEGYGFYDQHGQFKGWDGIDHEAGIVIRYPRDKDGQIDPERVVIGTFTVGEVKDPRAENNVPNLSDMDDAEELRAFADKHSGGKRLKDLFPNGGEGTKNATVALVNYAFNKLTAVELRKKGKVAKAQEYESICDTIYKELPAWARSW